MKDIIKDIRKYIQDKEKDKELHLTDDDIIEMIRIHKMNLAKKLWYNPDGNFKGFSTRTGNEQEEFILSLKETFHFQNLREFHNRPSNSHDGNGNEYTLSSDGKLHNQYPIMKYYILGRISEINSGLSLEAIEIFLEEIYAIYKPNEKKYETTFY